MRPHGSNSLRKLPRKPILEEFRRHLRDEEGFSHATERRYAHIVHDWLAYLGAKRKNVQRATYEDASDWYAGMRARYSTAYQAQILSSVRKFHEWLLREGYVAEQVFARVRGPRHIVHRPRVYVTDEEMARVMRSLEGIATFRELRDAALWMCFASAGIRARELVSANLRDVDWRKGTITVVKGKGGKSHIAPLVPEALDMLRRYVEVARAKYEITEHGPLFLGLRGDRITYTVAKDAILRVATRAGLTTRVTPHVLRRAAITGIYRETGDIKLAADFAGHEDPSTTARCYVRPDMERVIRSVEPVHPMRRWMHREGRQAP